MKTKKKSKKSRNSQVREINQEQLYGFEKWIMHYSNNQEILLVGEGDFSFALCLASQFGSGRNMIATSLDSKDWLWLHQNLVRAFFKSSREMLTKSGQIHVTHKTTYPFSEWEIVKLAEEAELFLVKGEEFSKLDFPGYKNRRGDEICDESFPVGKSSTFMFAKRSYPKTKFQPGALSISTWSADNSR